MTPMQIGELAAIGTALLWTLSALAWTSAGKTIGAISVSFIRLVITCAFLMVYGQLGRGLAFPTDADAHTWMTLGISGLLGLFLADICLFKALLLIGPRLSLLVQSLSPPIATLASWMLYSEKLAPRQWLAMVVTLAGVVWVVLERPESDAEVHRHRHLWWGVLLASLAAVGQALGFVLSRRGIGDYDAGAATFVRVLAAMAGYLVLLTLLRRWPSIMAATRHHKAMFIMTLGALVGPFLGVVLSMVAVRYCHAGVVTTIIGTMPILILPFAILLYGEKVSLRAAGGAVVSVVGVALLVL